MRCVRKLLVLFAILPVFAIGCGPASMDDNVTQEQLEAEALIDQAEEDAEETEGNEGDDTDNENEGE
jgi:hypothetical protein